MKGCFDCHQNGDAGGLAKKTSGAKSECKTCHITEKDGTLKQMFATGVLLPPDGDHAVPDDVPVVLPYLRGERTPLHDRVDAFVHQRTAVLESLSPVLRAALVHAASSEVIRGQFERGHHFFRLQVAEVFGPEIERSAEGEVLRHALVVALSWTAWDLLREAQEQSVAQARAVVTLLVRSLLAGVGDPW